MRCENSSVAQAAAAGNTRDLFPSAANLLWLNHAAVSPLCRPAADAMRGLIDDSLYWASDHYEEWLAAYEDFRKNAAGLIGAAPAEIAIVKNTSEGIATVQMGIDWRPGDRVVAFIEEFPSNYYPWKLLEARGVAVDWLSIYDPLERVEQAARRAKLLAISFVNYLSGHRVPLEDLGDICKRHNVFFLVDAIQGLGVLPLDVEACHIDALSADGHKWLMGPEGCGILYIRCDRMDQVTPREAGWTNFSEYYDYSSRSLVLRADAGRYECGTLNTVGVYGLSAAIRLVLDTSVPAIGERVLALSRRLAEGLSSGGFELIRPWDLATASGIVSFRAAGRDSKEIVRGLRQERISAAERQGWVRLAPHFYQTQSEMDRVIDLLSKI